MRSRTLRMPTPLPWRTKPLRGDIVTVGRYTDTVVFDLDEKSSLFGDLAAQSDGAAANAWLQSVFDAVFDERLQQHSWNHDVQGFVGDLLDDFQLLAEAHDFDVEVVVGEGELLAKGYEGFAVFK